MTRRSTWQSAKNFTNSPIVRRHSRWLTVLLVVITASTSASLSLGERQMNVPVDSLDVPKLTPSMDSDGTKVFRLTAQPVTKVLYPGFNNNVPITVWGFNGSMPGPTIEAVEGDRVRIIVRNELPEATTVHWHGLELPNVMDGAGEHTQKPIPPGGEYVYEFNLKQNGTFMYHSGYNQAHQVGMGLVGSFIVHPKKPLGPPVDRDFTMMLQMFSVPPGSTQPDTMSMEEQYFTINGISAPYSKHLKVKLGDRVRIRIANLSLMAHPIHLHGHTFKVTGTDGGRIPDSAQWPAATITVSPGETRDIEFTAIEPGVWMLHCHILHHIMNDMNRPNVPGKPMPMHMVGGMHTILEVSAK